MPSATHMNVERGAEGGILKRGCGGREEKEEEEK